MCGSVGQFRRMGSFVVTAAHFIAFAFALFFCLFALIGWVMWR